jgi:hypothetical protein
LPRPFPEAALLVRIEDCFDRFLLGRINECAGVHHQHICLIGARGDFHSVLQHASEHDLGIDQIFRATEADHADLGFLL